MCLGVDIGAPKASPFWQMKHLCYFRIFQAEVATTEPFVPVELAKKGWSQMVVLMRRSSLHKK